MKSIALLIIASLFGATSAFTTPRPACTKLVPTTTSLNIDFFKSNVAEKMEVSTESAVDDECEVPEEELSESQILMQISIKTMQHFLINVYARSIEPSVGSIKASD